MPLTGMGTALTLTQLRYFLVAVQAGSISRAAAQVRVAQPALSQQLGLLEAEFGQALLLRHARGVTPTEAGRRLRERATEILRQVELTRDELAVDASSPVGAVALGMATAANMAFSVEVLTRVRARYPRIRLHLVESMSGFLREWTERGRLDLSVLYEASRSPGLRLEPLREEELFLVASPAFAAGLGEVLTFNRLATLPLVLPAPAHGLRMLIDRKAYEAGIALDIRYEVDSTYTIKRLVAQNAGCSILSRHAIQEELAAGTLAAVRIGPPGIPRSIQLVLHPGRAADPSVAAVRSIIREVIAPST